MLRAQPAPWAPPARLDCRRHRSAWPARSGRSLRRSGFRRCPRSRRPRRCSRSIRSGWPHRRFGFGRLHGAPGLAGATGPSGPSGPQARPERKAHPVFRVRSVPPEPPARMERPLTNLISIPPRPRQARSYTIPATDTFLYYLTNNPVGTATSCGGTITLNLPVSTVVGAGRMVIVSPGNVPNRSDGIHLSRRRRRRTRHRFFDPVGCERFGPPTYSSQRRRWALAHDEPDGR